MKWDMYSFLNVLSGVFVWEMLYIVFCDHMLWMNEVNKFTKKSSISVLAQFVCKNMQENLSSVVPTRSDKNQAV